MTDPVPARDSDQIRTRYNSSHYLNVCHNTDAPLNAPNDAVNNLHQGNLIGLYVCTRIAIDKAPKGEITSRSSGSFSSPGRDIALLFARPLIFIGFTGTRCEASASLSLLSEGCSAPFSPVIAPAAKKIFV